MYHCMYIDALFFNFLLIRVHFVSNEKAYNELEKSKVVYNRLPVHVSGRLHVGREKKERRWGPVYGEP